MMLYELRPDALDNVRLPERLQQAAEALAGRGSVEVGTVIKENQPVPNRVCVEVYRIAQAAPSNAGRHSGAQNVQVQWQVLQPRQGRLRVSDDGRGFDPNRPHPGHFGLDNIRGRAMALGAELGFHSAPGQGTEIVLDVNWS